MIAKNWMKTLLYIGVGMILTITSAMAIGLVNSVPKINQVLKAGTQDIQLNYDHKFDPFRSRLLLIGSDNKLTLIPATTSLNHTQVQTKYLFTPGKYTLHWEIWTWDDKKSEGNIPFTVIP